MSRLFIIAIITVFVTACAGPFRAHPKTGARYAEPEYVQYQMNDMRYLRGYKH
ncbi:hypothetical protein [Vibrio mangrovi]|uniref:Lipoprotein n=1 Tax=Vibrio mangrovi TaxID=474394 RepID=A0A1Y6IQ12_9VIBR|nr:hypothetical protein [Vibrio mangrovi]MDW6004321.1 hypothetical protein [Vibrio mangrovi]SMR98880.1 hypothetical protein VIM7927_00093 [Vibrio mangrovi]